jgi:hypothetical protein
MFRSIFTTICVCVCVPGTHTHTHTTDDNDTRPHTVQEHNERTSTEFNLVTA